MAEIKFSQLTTAAQLTNDDIFALAQMQGGSLSSVKTSMIAVANFLNTQVQYTTAYNTQAKTTAGAINELKQLISLIPQFAIEVVEELPTEDISDTTIYLVPAEDPEVGNYYEEYIHVNDAWELVGTTAVDLSAYYTKLEVDGLLANKASVAEVALKENKTDMPTDVRTIIKGCKTPKNATITNGIAQFECIEENLVKGLKVSMNPIQDLHGYPNPWAGGAGKNKFDVNSVSTTAPNNWSVTVNNGALVVEHKNTYSTGTPISAPITLPTGTYSVSYTSSVVIVVDVHVNGSWRGSIPQSGSFTLTESSSVSIAFPNSTASTITYQNIQIESGSSATSYEPYSNICPISGRTEASVTRPGKNLFDKSSIISNYAYKNDTGHEYVSVQGISTYFIDIVAGTTLTISGMKNWGTGYINCFVNSNKEYIQTVGTRTSSGGVGNPVTVTAPNGARYLAMACYTGTSDYNLYQDKDTIQVEVGSTATAYEPYTAETKTHQYSETIYGGNDDFVNGGATSTMGMVDLGELNWTYVANYEYFYSTLPLASDNSIALCEIYKKTDEAYDGHQSDSSFKLSSTGNKRIFVCDRRFNSASAFKTAMDGVQLCYELATPTTISTSAEEITTVAGTNIISGTEPISECKYTELATVDDLRKIIGGQ